MPGLALVGAAFDSNLAPIVGQQVTLDRDNAAEVGPRIDLLLDRARSEGDRAAECELVASVRFGPLDLGFLYLEASDRFQSSFAGPALGDGHLRALAVLQPVTYTCVPLGSGPRIALDADLDGCPNTSERLRGSDPRDPASTPAGRGA